MIAASTGEIVPWSCYSAGVDRSLDEWKSRHPDLINAGVHLFQLSLWDTKGQMWDNPWTPSDGKSVQEPPETITWRKMATELTALDPQARFIMRFSVLPDLGWRKSHFDHYPAVKSHDGGVMKDGRSLIPSLASEESLKLAVQNVRDAIAWCERQPWRDRIVGYTIFNFGEGATEVALFDEMFDDTTMMRDAFRGFLRGKYRDDDVLQKAWDDKETRLDTATVPTRSDWLAKRERLKLFHWPDPAKVQRERDYFLLQKQLFHRTWSAVFTAMQEATAARPVLKGCDNLKQHMLGWLHNANFEADWRPGTMDTYNAIMLASGAIGAGPLLDHPGLDMLQTPGMYNNRAVGYAWEAEGLSDALALRGKVNFMEADMRTGVRKTWGGKPMPEHAQIPDAGTFFTDAEMVAGFDRTLAWALSRNQMFYYTSVCGANWWYHDPPVLKQIARQTQIIADPVAIPWRDTTDAICFVIDDESSLHEDFSSGFQHLAVERQLEEGLALCGVPYRIHLLSDLQRNNFPAYKCYLFPNLFKVDAEVEALLRKKVLRNGNVALFGPGTGITDGTTISADAASRLLGVKMEIVAKTCNRRVITQDHGHPLSKRIPTVTFTDSYAYGPLLVPAEQRFPSSGTARQLGACFYYYFFDRPGLFMNDIGQGADRYSAIFTPAVPLPAELLREFARYAGCHVWSEQNTVVRASDGFVSLHTAKGGEHVIRFPVKANVWDLNLGKPIARGTDTVRVSATGPSTWLFRFEPADRKATTE